jgi:hypothetical protein
MNSSNVGFRNYTDPTYDDSTMCTIQGKDTNNIYDHRKFPEYFSLLTVLLPLTSASVERLRLLLVVLEISAYVFDMFEGFFLSWNMQTCLQNIIAHCFCIKNSISLT